MRTQCPKCKEYFPSVEMFQSHAVSVHKAPPEVFSGQQAPFNPRPPGAQEIAPVPVPAIFDDTPSYEPANPTPRPKMVGKDPLTPMGIDPLSTISDLPLPSTGKIVIAPKPLTLKYFYDGECPECRCTVTTTIVEVKGSSFALGLCPKCMNVKATRKVDPL